MGKLEAGQCAILTELKGLRERQDAIHGELTRLAERLGTLKTKVFVEMHHGIFFT